MNLEVNQANLYLFLPSKVSRMAEMLIEDKGIGVVEAVKAIYASATYKQLEDEASKTWHDSPVGLYQRFVNASAART